MNSLELFPIIQQGGSAALFACGGLEQIHFWNGEEVDITLSAH